MIYLLKINIAIALFYAFYRLFFYKDTFFTWRRTALLCFFGVSALVPLLDIQTWISAQEPMAAVADLYSVMLTELTVKPQPQAMDWHQVMKEGIGLIYRVVAALLLTRLFVQLASILRLARQCPTQEVDGILIHRLSCEEGPFSFFRWIFVCPDAHSEAELHEILTHERTHARQWHSVDVLAGELACIACWFNPFVWLMRREIRTNLEYLADERVLATGHDAKAYQYHLLGLSHHKAAATIYNSFNVLPLKKRIIMMNKKRTRKIGRTKYLMFLPLAALLMIVSNIETVARSVQRVNKPLTTTESTQQEAPLVVSKDTADIFEVVEQMPVFPNGGFRGLMQYLGDNIRYPEAAKKAGTEGRVTVQFVVEKDGSISNVKTIREVSPDLDQEAIRVISEMPKWKPGTQRGEPVRVRYTVPVVFRLSEPATDQSGEVVGVSKEAEPSDVYEVVEQMPQFPGGFSEMMKYLGNNIQYPSEAHKNGIQGRVAVQVIIDTEGRVTNTRVVKGVDPYLDAEAIRVVSSMPKWNPGMQDGKPVNVKFLIPIMFRLQ